MDKQTGICNAQTSAPNFEGMSPKIAKKKENHFQAKDFQRNIRMLDRIINKGGKSANPNPILGTYKEGKLEQLRKERIQANNGIDPYEESLRTKYTTHSGRGNHTMTLFTPKSVNLQNGIYPNNLALTPNYANINIKQLIDDQSMESRTDLKKAVVMQTRKLPPIPCSKLSQDENGDEEQLINKDDVHQRSLTPNSLVSNAKQIVREHSMKLQSSLMSEAKESKILGGGGEVEFSKVTDTSRTNKILSPINRNSSRAINEDIAIQTSNVQKDVQSRTKSNHKERPGSASDSQSPGRTVMHIRQDDTVSSAGRINEIRGEVRESSQYNINFGKSTVAGSNPSFMNRTMGTHRSSLPPVFESRKRQKSNKRADIEELLHQLKTPTNPKVNVKFVKALQRISKPKIEENSKSNEFTSSNEMMGDKFEEIFGLLASEQQNSAQNTNVFVQPKDAIDVLGGKKFKSPFVPPLDLKPNMKEIFDQNTSPGSSTSNSPRTSKETRVRKVYLKKKQHDGLSSKKKTSRKRRGGISPRNYNFENTTQTQSNGATVQESLDISVKAALIDSRDEKFFGVNDFSKTMQAFAPNTTCNASRFPQKYLVKGIAEGKTMPEPPKSSLRKRRMTYDAYSERDIKMFQKAKFLEANQHDKFKARNKPFDLNLNNIRGGPFDETKVFAAHTDVNTPVDTLTQSMNMSPMSRVKLIDQLNIMRAAETASVINRRQSHQTAKTATEDGKSQKHTINMITHQSTHNQVHLATLGKLPPLMDSMQQVSQASDEQLEQMQMKNVIQQTRQKLVDNSENETHGESSDFINETMPLKNLAQQTTPTLTVDNTKKEVSKTHTENIVIGGFNTHKPDLTPTTQVIVLNDQFEYHPSKQSQVSSLGRNKSIAGTVSQTNEREKGASPMSPVSFDKNKPPNSPKRLLPAVVRDKTPSRNRVTREQEFQRTALQQLIAVAQQKAYQEHNKDNFYWEVQRNPEETLDEKMKLREQVMQMEKLVKKKQQDILQLREAQLQKLIDSNELAQQRLKLRDLFIKTNEMKEGAGSSTQRSPQLQRPLDSTNMVINRKNRVPSTRLSRPSKATSLVSNNVSQDPLQENSFFSNVSATKSINTKRSSTIEGSVLDNKTHSFYQLTVQNNLQKEKKETSKFLRQVSYTLQYDKLEAQQLRIENTQLKKFMRRYGKFINKFEETWDDKYLTLPRRKKLPKLREIPLTTQLTSKKVSDPVDPGSPFLKKDIEIDNVSDEKFDTKQSEVQSSQYDRSNAQRAEPSADKIFHHMDSAPSHITARSRTNFSQALLNQGKFDVESFSKLLHQVKQACRQEKCLDLVLSMLEIIKSFSKCEKVMIVPIDSYMQQVLTSKKLNTLEKLQYTREFDFMDDFTGATRKLYGVAKTSNDMCPDLILKSIVNLDHQPEINFEKSKVAITIHHDKEKQPLFVIQMEFKQMVGKRSTLMTEAQTQIDIAPVQSEIKGNKMMEAHIIHLVFQAVQLKFERILYHQQNRDEKAMQKKTIDLVERCMGIITIKGLARYIMTEVPSYLGFESCNVMFHDFEKDQLYTITFGDEEERKQKTREQMKSASSEQRSTIQNQEEMNEIVVQFNNMIQYPVHSGMTSKIFSKLETRYYNNFTPQTDFDFQSETDNPKGIKKIDNLIMSPLEVENEDQASGVLQIFNKAGIITKFEVDRFVALAKLFAGVLKRAEMSTMKLTRKLSITLHHGVAVDAAQRTRKWIYDNGASATYEDIQKMVQGVEQELKKQSQN